MGKKSVLPVQAMKNLFWIKSLFFWCFLFTGIFLAETQIYARSTPWEYYSKYKIIIPTTYNRWKLQLSIKEEARFKNGIRYYNKIPLGFLVNLRKNWKIGFYYALKNKRNKNRWENYHLLWSDLVYHYTSRKIEVNNRHRFELHLTEKAQRYRNLFQIKLHFLKGKLISWTGDEIRYFFNKGQFAMNEIFAGLIFKPVSHLAINLYYDYRLIKNKNNSWEKTNVIQSMIIYQF